MNNSNPRFSVVPTQKALALNTGVEAPVPATLLNRCRLSPRARPPNSPPLSLVATLVAACLAAFVTAVPAQARDLVREPVEFVLTHDEFRAFLGREALGPGFEEIHLLGDLPELGGGEILQAIEVPWTHERDANGAIVEWRVTVSLPVNRDYSYQFHVVAYKPVKPTAPDICSPVTAEPASPVFNAATSNVSLGQKTVFLHSDGANPIIHWRQGGESFQELAMEENQVQVVGRPGEKRWVAQFGEANREVEFFLTTGKGNKQELVPGNYRTHLNRMLVQDENLFTYIPAPQVSPTRRDFDKNDPPALFSSVMGEFRDYRVWLPRGYDDHPDRHYPTIYAHDGQWWFGDNPSSHSGNAWNQIDPKARTVSREVAQGRMQEAIFVLVDSIWESRTQDMLPPYINDCGINGPVVTGEGHLYREFIVSELMPYINSHYRTLSGPANTGTAGLSFGGVAAFYHGWDFVDGDDRPLDFGRIGSFSGSFWTCGLLPKIFADSRRDDIRVYFDSGDDNDLSNWRLFRARFVRSEPPYELENDFRYHWHCHEQHQGPHWKKRLPLMMNFLFPGSEAADELPGL
jgi:enterochelin esterase-like enzyme